MASTLIEVFFLIIILASNTATGGGPSSYECYLHSSDCTGVYAIAPDWLSCCFVWALSYKPEGSDATFCETW